MSTAIPQGGQFTPAPRLQPKPSSRAQFVLAGLLLLVAPLSGSGDSTTTIKLVRIALSVAMVVGCFAHFNRARVGKLSRGLLGVALLYTLAAVWSKDPVYGLLHKGMFLASVIAGIVLAASLNSISDLRVGLRTIAPFICFGIGAVVFAAVADPNSHYVFGRLAVFGINANAIGQSAAAMLILSVSHIVLDRSKWRYLSGLNLVALGWIVIATGSRGSVLMAAAGCALVCVGAFRGVARNIGGVLVFLAMTSPALVLVGAELTSDYGAEGTIGDRNWTTGGGRIQRELLKDTRSEMWAVCLKQWKASPVVGVGWFAANHRSRSTMNMYLQVLVECGIVGVLFLAIWLISLLSWCARLAKVVGGWPAEYRVCAWLSLGCVFGLLIHGIAESSILLGTTVNPLLLGFSVVMVERMPVMFNVAARPRKPGTVPKSRPARPMMRPSNVRPVR